MLHLIRSRSICLGLLAGLVTLSGCRTGSSSSSWEFRQLNQEMAGGFGTAPAAVANPAIESAKVPETLDELIVLALDQNSEVQEQRLRVESLAYRVPQAASLPDPQLTAAAFPAPVQTAAGEQDFALGLKQTLPARNKLTLKACIAEQDVQTARAQLAAIELKVVQEVKQAWFRLQFAYQAVEIVDADARRLDVIRQLVGEMYQVKQEVTQQDVLQVDVARSRLQTERYQYQADLRRAQADLARLLHVSPETTFPAQPPREVRAIQADVESDVRNRIAIAARVARSAGDPGTRSTSNRTGPVAGDTRSDIGLQLDRHLGRRHQPGRQWR